MNSTITTELATLANWLFNPFANNGWNLTAYLVWACIGAMAYLAYRESN